MDTIDWSHLNTIWNVTDIYNYVSYKKKNEITHVDK